MNKLVILFLVFAALGSIEAFRKVAIEDIRYLRLYKGRFTTSPYPGSQLACVENGAGLCADHELDYVGCKNLFSNQGQVTWDCHAILSKGVKFGRTDVSCEPLPNSQYDGYVVEGSCYLRYTLIRS